MKYDLEAIPRGGSVLDSYPELSKVYELSSSPLEDLEKHRDFILRWIVWMHDPSTPANGFTTLPERRSFVRKKVGVLGKGQAWFVEMEKYNNSIVNRMIVAFLRTEYSMVYAEYKTFEVIHAKLLESLLESPTANNMTALKSVRTEISSCKDAMLTKERSLKLEETLEAHIIQENLEINLLELIKDFNDGKEIHSRYSV
jgi:hypothetical protein